MKYSIKNIFGFDNSMRSLMPFNCNDLKQCWGAKIEVFEISKLDSRQIIRFNFTLNGDLYGVILKPQNDKDDYKGRILCEGDEVGTCFYTLYSNKTRLLLLGRLERKQFYLALPS